MLYAVSKQCLSHCMTMRRDESSQSLCVMLSEWWKCAVVLRALNLDTKLGDGHALPPAVCGVESSHLYLWRKVLAVPCPVAKSVDCRVRLVPFLLLVEGLPHSGSL